MILNYSQIIFIFFFFFFFFYNFVDQIDDLKITVEYIDVHDVADHLCMDDRALPYF